jgi:hypothetical protein
MIAALQGAYRRVYEALNRITPASWIFDRLGRLIVATPEELKQAEDFWVDSEDRQLPTAKDYALSPIQMEQVGFEHFRRHLRRDLAVFTMLVCMVLSAVVYSVGMFAIWAITPGVDSPPGVPAAAGLNDALTANEPAPVLKRREARAPAEPPAVSPEYCRQLRHDLDPTVQRRFLTEPGIFDQSNACKEQFGI